MYFGDICKITDLILSVDNSYSSSHQGVRYSVEYPFLEFLRCNLARARARVRVCVSLYSKNLNVHS